MSLVQVNLAHAFNLRVVVGSETATFGLKRGINWVDESLRDTPEWKLMIKRLELPLEAVQAAVLDPAQGMSGGVPVNPDLLVQMAKENQERAKQQAQAQKKAQEEAEQKAKDEALTLDKAKKEIEANAPPKSEDNKKKK